MISSLSSPFSLSVFFPIYIEIQNMRARTYAHTQPQQRYRWRECGRIAMNTKNIHPWQEWMKRWNVKKGRRIGWEGRTEREIIIVIITLKTRFMSILIHLSHLMLPCQATLLHTKWLSRYLLSRSILSILSHVPLSPSSSLLPFTTNY